MAEYREEPPPMNDHDDNDADRSDKEDDDLFSSAIDVRVDLFDFIVLILVACGLTRAEDSTSLVTTPLGVNVSL